MSLIGNLEQLSLPTVLQRIEAQGQTGLLVVKQGILWVEFYFRQGWLMCVGPVRTNATLGERLVQTGILSEQAWQEARRKMGTEAQTEVQIALTLFNLGLVSDEELRAWSTQRAAEVIQAILYWTQGEIYFEEQIVPPADRLLVAIIASSLLPAPTSIPVPSSSLSPAATPAPQTDAPARKNSTFLAESATEHSLTNPQSTPMPATSLSKTSPRNPYSADISNVPTLLDPSQFRNETPTSIVRSLPGQNTDSLLPSLPALPSLKQTGEEVPSTPLLNEEAASFISLHLFDEDETPAQAQPTPVRSAAGQPIDISLMHPDMLLVEIDPQSLSDQKVEFQITPDQWRVLTRVDGQTSLRRLCQEFTMTPEHICQIAGELVLLGLIQLVLPGQTTLNEMSPILRGTMPPTAPPMPMYYGQANPTIPDAQASRSTPLPSTARMPSPVVTPDATPPLASTFGIETESQWGNGGNGATFITGRGWVVKPQPLQPLPASGPIAVSLASSSSLPPVQPSYAYPTGMKSGVL